jgi:glycosyltransferase involved in cell wall biosynthesis
MSEAKVSVIVPFYNGAEYIRETLTSILTQSLKEIEIICVDDESTDDTYAILQEYARTDDRLTVLKQEKSNAGAARNLGKKHATGEYLLFLDSDDLFETDMIERMYRSCKESDADVCVCNANQYDNEKQEYIEKPQYLREKLLPETQPFSRKQIGKYILYFTTSVPWNKMVKRSLVEQHEITFQEIPRANDQFFSIMCLILAERITVVREKLVHYRVKQKENLTTNYSETPLCSYDAMLKTKERLDEMELLGDTDIRCAFDNKVLNLLLYSLNIQRELDSYQLLYNKMKEEGFEKLGFCLHEKEYYFNSLEHENLCMMLEHSCQEYLFLKNYGYRDTIARKNTMLQKRNSELNHLKKEKKELQKKEKELNYIKSTKRYQCMEEIATVYRKIFAHPDKSK